LHALCCSGKGLKINGNNRNVFYYQHLPEWGRNRQEKGMDALLTGKRHASIKCGIYQGNNTKKQPI
jgi:hypothetical protein